MKESILSGTASYEPWDMTPASESQKRYVRNLLDQLGNADLDGPNATMMTEAINGLNKARKALGVPFEDFG